ncbi:MAG: site-specific integrase [Saprospiraceae bacterium]|nr:site-specific integrase [Saprospiraceae bacterium]
MIKVKLRTKSITGNRQSFYLDFYPAIPHPKTGKLTRREFLGLYIFDNPKNPIDKLHNKETEYLAQQMRQKTENRLNKPEIYTDQEKIQLKNKELGERNFVEYFKQLMNKRIDSNYDNWNSAYLYLLKFTNGTLKFADLNESILNDFKEYLLTVKSNRSNKSRLSQNSASSYFNKVKAALKQAFKDGLLQLDLNGKIKSIKEAETQRNFLSIEELNMLVKTDCKNPLMKRAALFSALTGMRFGDIKKLVWGEIEYLEGQGYIIKYKQQKTKGAEVLPISDQTYEMLGIRQAPNEKVFKGLNYSAYENKHLSNWIGIAGITKDITFHCFRHTYATIQLSKDTNIYTVSKMLGHRNLKTTQIYAKIIDRTKREAADKIKLDF